jgi:ribosomal protein L9
MYYCCCYYCELAVHRRKGREILKGTVPPFLQRQMKAVHATEKDHSKQRRRHRNRAAAAPELTAAADQHDDEQQQQLQQQQDAEHHHHWWHP